MAAVAPAIVSRSKVKETGKERVVQSSPGNARGVSFPADWPDLDHMNTRVWKVAKDVGGVSHPKESASELLVTRKYASPDRLSCFNCDFCDFQRKKKFYSVRYTKS